MAFPNKERVAALGLTEAEFKQMALDKPDVFFSTYCGVLDYQSYSGNIQPAFDVDEDGNCEASIREMIGEMPSLDDDTDNVLGLRVEEVFREGGHEGDGEEVEVVFSVYDAVTAEIITYFAFYGSYQSYDGTTWDEDAVKVYPYTYTQTRYSKDKK